MRLRAWTGGVLIAASLLVTHLQAAPDEIVALPIFNATFHGAKYETCTVDLTKNDLHLYWSGTDGKVLGDFTALQKQAAFEKDKLIFATNAGMFDPTSKPVGLYVQNGEEKFPLNLNEGTGNFYAKPNGVFAINAKHHAFIVESGDYQGLVPPILWATQSGPLLVHGGDVNPDFLPDSKNRRFRSGVGIAKSGEIVFALSRQAVTFYEFAELFREKLHCPNALYLDGDVSAFWTPGKVETANQHHFGPMIGVTAAPANP